MANTFNWSLGHEGKGNVYDDGTISTWNTSGLDNHPHHLEVAAQDERKPAFKFYLSPEGGLHDGGISFQNNSPHTDDQQVAEVIAQHPAIWDGRDDDTSDLYQAEPRNEYGHAYNLMDTFSKVAKEEGWADFHTELKLPRSTRKQIRRWVDRLKWPAGAEKADIRTYHITILSMDEYDEDFAKWSKSQVQGKTFNFKSIGMAIFNDCVVLKLESPEWTELVLDWQEKADEMDLKPRKFNPPEAHVSIGKTIDGKWPQGVPDPHVKFDTRMFNINKNAMAADPKWLDSYMEKNGPYLYHITDPENVPSILQHGLIPWDQLGDRGTPQDHGTPFLRPRPGHTYLRYESDPLNEHHPNYSGLLKVDLSKLDPERLNPDEDSMVDGPGWRDKGESLGDIAQTEGWSDPKHTQRSLEKGKKTVAYEGTIPPDAIEAPNYQEAKPIYTSANEADDDLKAWLDSFTVEEANQPPSLHHTDADDFTPQVVAPVVQTPHVDPPSKPYTPYNWAEEGWEQSPLDRTASATRAQKLKHAEQVERMIGTSDQSQIIHQFSDGHSVRQLQTYGDAVREGELMGNCLSPYQVDPESHHPIWHSHPSAIFGNPNDPWGESERDDEDEYEGIPDGADMSQPLPTTIHSLRDSDNIPHLTDDEQEMLGTHNIPPKDEYFNYMAQWRPNQYLAPENRHEDLPGRMSAIDTHICPQCGEDSDAPICPTCGYDGQASPDGYTKMKTDWYDRAWERPGDQPRPVPNQPMHWRDDHAKNVSLAKVSEAPQSLPMDDELYYRAHHVDAPFGVDHAYSAPIEGADIPEQYTVPKEGYSAFWNPHHLQQYMEEMGWDTQPRNVVAFRGKAVGSGLDGEPLVMPHNDKPEATIPYQDFLNRLEYTPNGYGQWHEHTWGDGPNGQQVDDGYRSLGEIGSSRKEINDLDHPRGWIVSSEPGTRESSDSMPAVWSGEQGGLKTDHDEDQSALRGVRELLSGSSSVGGWPGF